MFYFGFASRLSTYSKSIEQFLFVTALLCEFLSTYYQHVNTRRDMILEQKT